MVLTAIPEDHKTDTRHQVGLVAGTSFFFLYWHICPHNVTVRRLSPHCELYQSHTHTLSLSLMVYIKWGSKGGVTSGVFCVLSGSQCIPQSPLSAWLPLVTTASCTHTHINTHSHHNGDLAKLRPRAAVFPEQNFSLSLSLDSTFSSPSVSPPSKANPLALSGPLYKANSPRLYRLQ